MMKNFQTYFENIQEVARNYLNTAQKTILIAAVEFTDEVLYHALLLALQRNVSIALVLSDHNTQLDWDELVRNGAILYWYSANSTISHKFAVIDEKITLIGSNWTTPAGTFPQESLLVFEESNMAQTFKVEFEKLCQKATPHHASRSYSLVSIPNNDTFQAELLRAEIASLQVQIASLQEEKNRIESLVKKFEMMYHRNFDEYFLRIKELEMMIAQRKAYYTEKPEDKAVSAERQREFESLKQLAQSSIHQQTSEQETFVPPHRHQAKEQHQTQAQPEEPPTSFSHTEAELITKLYREAMMKIHPDLFFNDPEKYEQAQRLAQRLNIARRENDLQTIQEIWRLIQEDIAFQTDVHKTNDVEKLKKIRDKLLAEKQVLEEQIKALKKSASYRVIEQYPDWNDYFEQVRQQLQTQIAILERELKKWK